MKGPTNKLPPSAKEMFTTAAVVTPESLLLDVVERLGRIRHGWVAAQVHLSQLKPQNRQEAHLRIAMRMFDPLVSGYRCQVFLMTDSDIIIIGRDVPMVDLDSAVFRLRALFDKDPLTYTEGEDGHDPFATFYHLEDDYDYFLQEAERLRAVVEARKRNPNLQAKPEPKPLNSELLIGIMAALNDVDMLKYLQRQAAIQVVSSNHARVILQEYFLSMQDLRRDVAPDVDLFTNRWLFLHFTQGADRRSLVALQNVVKVSKPPVISLNLNLSTLETPEFAAFEKGLLPGQTLNIEVQLIDVFADLKGFFKTRDALRAKGYKVILDGMMPSTLHFTDISKLGMDYIKVMWSPELIDPHHPTKGREPKDIIAELGPMKFILTRCDSEASIRWGLSMGILAYQGHLIDTMVTLTTMAACPDQANCTAQQCSSRRNAAGGAGRLGCTNFAGLDSFPEISLDLLTKRISKKA